MRLRVMNQKHLASLFRKNKIEYLCVVRIKNIQIIANCKLRLQRLLKLVLEFICKFSIKLFSSMLIDLESIDLLHNSMELNT